MISALAQHLWIATMGDLLDMHKIATGSDAWPSEGRVLIATRIKHALELRCDPSFSRYRASLLVANRILKRWRTDGIRRWHRDVRGLPVPLLAADAIEHRWCFAFEVTPSGKSLFECWGCEAARAPIPGAKAACPGRALGRGDAQYDIALAVFGGAAYAPDTLGILRPTRTDLVACACCGQVGSWSERDIVGMTKEVIMQIKAVFLLLALAALAGCGDPHATSSSSTGAGGGDAGPARGELRIETTPYTLAPGQEDRYFCFVTRVPSPAPIVTRVTPLYGQGVHHLVSWSPLFDENHGEDGAFHCPELVKGSWFPFYTGGVASSPLVMPAGTGFPLVNGQQILIQLHLLNTTSETITDRAGVILETSDEAGLVPAGFYGTNNQVITIPPLAQDFPVTQTCTAPRDMDVFAVFGHMHTHGQRLRLSRGPVDGQNVVYEAPWLFDDQPTVPVAFHLAAGEAFTVACTYDNPGASPIGYGESTFDEMCAFVMYHTPWTAAGGPGCVKTAP